MKFFKLGQTVKVRPNLPLNRTLCGGPSLGFKSLAQTRPAAKGRLAQTIGAVETKPKKWVSTPWLGGRPCTCASPLLSVIVAGLPGVVA